ncbi:MAG: hypothetical protein ACREE3_06200 [Stellaceae bacterium]
MIGARAGLPSLIAIVLGLAGMIVGFLAMAGIVPAIYIGALPVGGGLVVAGVLLVGVTIARALVAGWPLALPGRFVAAGLCFLLLTVGLGFCFALALAWPQIFPWGSLVGRGLPLHVASGLVGWFTLTAVGVSYRLLSMFMLAPEDDSGIGPWVLYLAAAGLAFLWLDTFLGDVSIIGFIWKGGMFLLIVAAVLYLVDMVRMFGARRRPVLELNSKAGATALVALAVCVVGLAAVEVTGRWESLIGPLCYLLLFGWLSGLALGQLYKIIPFLTWLERYGPRLGKMAVPRVQDLVKERRASRWFILYFLAVAAGTISGAFDQITLWRAAIFLHLVASLFITRELWRSRHLRYLASANATKTASRAPALSHPTRLSP